MYFYLTVLSLIILSKLQDLHFPSFPFSMKERTTCRQRKTWNWWAANSFGTQRVQTNSSTHIWYCLHRQRQEKDQEGEHKLQVSVTGTALYLLLSFKLQLTSKYPFTDPASFHVHADICSHTALNYKSDQNSHLLLALGSSDHKHVKFYIVEICNFIVFCAG